MGYVRAIACAAVFAVGVVSGGGCAKDEPSESADRSATGDAMSSGAGQSTAQSGDRATAAADTAAARTPATQPASGVEAQAKQLLDDTTRYIKENKLDLADKSLSTLETLKPQLPQSYHGRIDTARSMFNAAKKGQGLLGGSP